MNENNEFTTSKFGKNRPNRQVGFDDFISSGFEEFFINYSKKFGLAGKDVATGKPRTRQDFRYPDPTVVTAKSEYQTLLTAAIRREDQYFQHKSELTSELMEFLRIDLQNAVSQHHEFKAAYDSDDIIKLWNIVLECATGTGTHSKYLAIFRMLHLEIKSDDVIGFNEYNLKFEKHLKELGFAASTISDQDAKKLLVQIINAKYVQGIHKSKLLKDKVDRIMGLKDWPDYESFRQNIHRYLVNLAGLEKTKDNGHDEEGAIIIDQAKTFPTAVRHTSNTQPSWTCYNCGQFPADHKAPACPKLRHKCSICTMTGHLEKFCPTQQSSRKDGKKVSFADYNKKPSATVTHNYGSNNNSFKNKQTSSDKSKKYKLLAKFAAGLLEDSDEEPNATYDNELDVSYDHSNEEAVIEEEFLSSSTCSIHQFEPSQEDSDCHHNLSVSVASASSSPAVFVIDTGCVGSAHVVNDHNLLDEISQSKKYRIEGYDGQVTTSATTGHVPGIGNCVVVDKAPNNLLNLLKLCRDIDGYYKGDDKQMEIYDKNDNLYATAKDNGDGFLAIHTNSISNEFLTTLRTKTSNHHILPIQNKHFSAEEIHRAKEAYLLCEKLGHPGDKALIAGLENNIFQTHLTSKDVRNGIELYGKCPACTEGRMIAPKKLKSLSPPASQIGEVIYADILEYEDLPNGIMGGYTFCLYTVDEKSGHIMQVGLKSKGKMGLLDGFAAIVTSYLRHGFLVQRVVTDDEKNFHSIKDGLAKLKISLTTTPAGMHNSRAEASIKRFKMSKRSIQASLSFNLPTRLEQRLNDHVEFTLNSLPNPSSQRICSFQLVTGQKPIIPLFKFGAVGIFYSPRQDTPNQRAEWGIFLGHLHNQQNSLLAYFPHRPEFIYSRRKFSPQDVIPQEWQLNPRIKLTLRDRTTSNTSPLKPIPPTLHPNPIPGLVTRPNLPLSTILDTAPPDASEFPIMSPLTPSHPPPLNPDDDPLIDTTTDDDIDAPTLSSPPLSHLTPTTTSTPPSSPSSSFAAPQSTHFVSPPTPTTPASASPSPSHQEGASNPSFNSNRAASGESSIRTLAPTTRSGRTVKKTMDKLEKAFPDLYHSRIKRMLTVVMQDVENIESVACSQVKLRDIIDIPNKLMAYRISLNKALKDPSRLEANLDAIKKELCNLYTDHQAIMPIKMSQIPRNSQILNAHMFLKDKFNADGSFQKTKGRMVINGNEEDESSIENTYSPTVNIISLMIMIAQAAVDGLLIDTFDIVGAFLATPMRQGKRLFIRTDATLSKLACEQYPELAAFLTPNGQLYFEVKKYVYGLSEASREFHILLDKRLKEIGFVPSTHDECVYIRDTADGAHRICTHVDDIMSFAPSERERLRFSTELKSMFEVNGQEGEDLSYLGISIHIDRKEKTIALDQHFFIENLYSKFRTLVAGKKPVDTPASLSTLLDESQSNSPVLDNNKLYLSLIMGLMYVARITRPDILFPVTYLASHCSKPTQHHLGCALRILRYLVGTKEKHLIFNGSSPATTRSLEAYADASHLFHRDGKGHSGVMITYYGTMVCSRSVKQKCQSRSSTESELIAMEEATTYIKWIREFLSSIKVPEQSYNNSQPTILYQDNKSAIVLAHSGGNFKRIKHMIGKVSYIKERLLKGDVELMHLPTHSMVADMLTKPLAHTLLDQHSKTIGLMFYTKDNKTSGG